MKRELGIVPGRGGAGIRAGLCFLLTLVGAASSMAQQAVPAASTASSSAQSGKQNQKNGTGVVPSGVKLVPEMPAPETPNPFPFSASGHQNAVQWIACFCDQ